MIEVRPYDGSAEALAPLLDEAWREYDGRAFRPIWTPELLDWQVLKKPRDPDLCLAAYDDGALVGFIGAHVQDYALHGKRLRGSYGSWFTTSSRARGKGVGQAIAGALRELHRKHQIPYFFGIGSAGTAGTAWWLHQKDTTGMAHVPSHIAVLDRPKAVQWAVKDADRAALMTVGRMLAYSGGGPRPREMDAYRPEDLDACLTLVSSDTGADLTMLWTQDTLRWQLEGSKLSRTRVWRDRGRVRAMINWYPEILVGRIKMLTMGVDLVAAEESLPMASRVAFVRAAFDEMISEGAGMAWRFGPGAIPEPWLRKAGFFPGGGDPRLLAMLQEPGKPCPPIKSALIIGR